MSEKKARSFNLEEMLGKTIKTAQERSKDTLKKREEDQIEENKAKEAADPGPAIPSGFVPTMKKSLKRNVEKETKPSDDVGPVLPSGFVPTVSSKPTEPNKPIEAENDSDSSSSSDSDSDEEEDSRMQLPISSEITLNHGTKPISAIALDPSGARLLTGGNDYMMKFWDFPGMTQTLEPFRYLEPQEGHHIKSLSYSASGDNILVVTGSCQPLLYDRDGFLVATSVKGDNYLMDATKTPGHQAMTNAGEFHPIERNWYVTASNDGTVRQWDVEERKKDMFGSVIIEHHDVRRIKNKQGKRTQPTALAYDRTGQLVGVGSNDGQIQIWDIKRTVAPKKKIFNAHLNAHDITSVQFSYDNTLIASRSTDGFVKIWDLRNIKEPLNTRNRFNSYSQ